MLPARLSRRNGPAQSFAIERNHETLPSIGLAGEEIAHYLLEGFYVYHAA